MFEEIIAGSCLCMLSIQDIKRKAVDLRILAVMFFIAIAVKIYMCIAGESCDIKPVLIAMIIGAAMVITAHFTHMIGIGDGVVMALMCFMVGVKIAVAMLLAALFLVAIAALFMIITDKVKCSSGRINRAIPLIPFMLVAYMGVLFCT